MKLKKENPDTIWRCKLLNKCTDIELPINTLLLITGAIYASNEKEKLAEKILTAISEETEEEEIKAKVMEIINK